jgi:hypothetical protein
MMPETLGRIMMDAFALLSSSTVLQRSAVVESLLLMESAGIPYLVAHE